MDRRPVLCFTGLILVLCVVWLPTHWKLSIQKAWWHPSEESAEPAVPSITGIYTGWVGFQNLGDDLVEDTLLALLQASLQEMAAKTGARVEAQYEPVPMPLGANESTYGFAILGGGSLLSPDYLSPLKAAVAAGAPLLAFGTGRQHRCDDHSDAFKESVCETLAFANNDWRLFGGVRGPLTRTCLRRLCGFKLPIIRDSGLLTPVAFAPAALRVERPLVVMSFKEEATSPFLQSGFDAASEEVAFKVQLTRQLAQDHAVVLLPAMPSNNGIHEHVLRQATSEEGGRGRGGLDLSSTGPRVQIYNAPASNYSTLLSLFKAARWSYSERLHPGVISASVGTPFLFFYNSMKFADFVLSNEALKSSDFAVNSRAAAIRHETPGELLSAVQDRIRVLEQGRQGVSEALLAAVPDTAERYKAAIAGFLLKVSTSPRTAATFRALLACPRIVIRRSLPHGYSTRLLRIACAPDPPVSSSASEAETSGRLRRRRRLVA